MSSSSENRDGQSAPDSRLSKTNPADSENRSQTDLAVESRKRRLTERDDVTLRKEAIEDDEDGLVPKTWRGAVYEWRDWYEDSRDTAAVFENLEGDRVKGSDPNRFHPDYGDKQYAKLKDLERGIKAEYGNRLYTAMLTLTASSAPGENDEPLPPVDHLDGLMESWSAVTRELRRCLEGRRWERLAILEPHKSGYIHVHVAVFVEGVVTAETFEPVIDAHLRNCELAELDAHDIEDDSTVSVRYAGGRESDEHLDELAIYLAEYLGTYGEDPLEQPAHVQEANTILWATGSQRWRPSNGAQEYMSQNRSLPDPDWELVGIEDGSGEVHEIEGEVSGGVTTLKTWFPDRDGPPPDEQ